MTETTQRRGPEDRLAVAIVDDHSLFREGVRRTLEDVDDMEVVGEGQTADDAVRLACELLPDLILVDLHMPGGGLSAIQAIAAACPVTRVVVLTVSEREADVVAALRAGARGYILKGVPAHELVGILRRVRTGEAYVSPSLAAALLAQMGGPSTAPGHPASPLDALTLRERQILEHLARGESNKEIGRDLGLTEKTVKHYVTNILEKLQVRNRVEAALLAHTGARG